MLKDLSPSNIYVFTPKGRILHLQKGSTPVDFAYAIHTGVGNQCSKVKINHKISQLSTVLQNGDVVEIITNPNGEPDKEWLNFVVSGKAISKIKQYFKEQKSDEEINVGVNLLNYGLVMCGLQSLDRDKLEHFIQNRYPSFSQDDFLQRIGVGDLSVFNVIEQMTKQPISIYLSKCIIHVVQDEKCYPVPGEEILARITRRGELELHYNKCSKLRSLGVDDFASVSIINDIEKEFLSKIILFIDNKPGVFNKLSAVLAERRINMEEIHQEKSEDVEHNELHLTITTHSVKEINDLLESLRNSSFVIQAIRI
jgi:(p)ppGpp synthase/HD superfamily hydrolase